METFTSFLQNFFKLDQKILVISLAILYILYLILPETLPIIKLVESYKLWAHLIGALSTIYSTTLFLIKVYQLAVMQINFLNKRNYLKKLSKDEKCLLKEYIYKERKTVNLPWQDGTVQHLVNLGIIYRTTDVTGALNPRFDFTINQWAFEYLTKNRELIKTDNALVAFVGGNQFYPNAK